MIISFKRSSRMCSNAINHFSGAARAFGIFHEKVARSGTGTCDLNREAEVNEAN